MSISEKASGEIRGRHSTSEARYGNRLSRDDNAATYPASRDKEKPTPGRRSRTEVCLIAFSFNERLVADDRFSRQRVLELDRIHAAATEDRLIGIVVTI